MFISRLVAFSNYTYYIIVSSVFFTVIGGKNIYLRLSVSGECDKKVSVWETLVKEVL